METLIPVLGLATIGSLAGLSGGVILLTKKNWGKFLSVHSIPFAAGVMLAVSLLDVLPEAVEEAGPEKVFPIVLAVMVAAFFFEQFFLHLHHHEEHKRTLKNSLPLVVAGDTIHNFIDGLAIAAAYLVEPALGVVVAGATFLHEIPHEMGDFGLMLAGGWSRLRVISVNILSALSTYAGAILIVLFSSTLGLDLGVLLAVAGGLFLYIAASDLLPEVESQDKDNPWHQALLFLAGVVIVWILTLAVPGV